MNPRDDAGARACGPGLNAADFRRIAANGFGDPENSYAHSMTTFGEHVYVGTLRNAFPLLKLFPPRDPPVMDPWPVSTVADVEDLDLLAQVWRWDPRAEGWEKVFTSPQIPGKNGRPAPRDIGYRGMAVFQGRSDARPTLYVSTISTVLRGTAALILRSEDGRAFEPVSEPGLGNPNVSTFRSLIAFDGHLFAAPAGEGTTWNTLRNPVIMRSADPVAGRWEVACPPGFGDPTNGGIFELATFDDHLYAGTFNHYEGLQIWKTPATGDAPCRWTKVLDRGAHRGNLNEMPLGMSAFDGALYVGTGIQNGGYDRNHRIGPAAGELLRIHPDDSWDLVVGEPRRTPEGPKYPLSGMGPGFDDRFAGYIWRLVSHEGWLYASTFDWSMFLAYAQRPPEFARRLIRSFGVDHLIRLGGGFQLWRSRDGRHWIPVTRTGLGNPYNHGGRTLLSTPHGLLVGTANPFGPTVAARISSGWVYVPNPLGGAEVWVGRSPEPWPGVAADADEQPRGQPVLVRHGTHVAGRAQALPQRVRQRRNGGGPRVLLTGAAGFVGSHVLERLLAIEDRVRVFELPESAARMPRSPRVEIVSGDLSEARDLERAVKGIATVYHLAALLPGRSHVDLMSVNAGGTELLLRACAQAMDVERFVYASSTAVYEGAFHPPSWPLSEVSAVRPRGPQSLRSYGLSKVSGEHAVRKYAREGGFEYVIVRPSVSYGVGDRMITALAQRVLLRRVNGATALDRRPLQPVHVRDLADAVCRAGMRPEAANEVYTVSGVETFSVGDIAGMIRRWAGLGGPRALWPDDSRHWRRYVLIYDVEKAQSQLGYIPRVAMQEGLTEIAEAVLTGGTRASEHRGGALWTYS